MIFEPHNGFGSMGLDEQPYPFGYISEGVGRPIFELGVPLLKPSDPSLLPLALKMTAAEDLYDLCVEMVDCLDSKMVEAHDSGGLAAMGITHSDEGCSLCKARHVLAKAEGKA